MSRVMKKAQLLVIICKDINKFIFSTVKYFLLHFQFHSTKECVCDLRVRYSGHCYYIYNLGYVC